MPTLGRASHTTQYHPCTAEQVTVIRRYHPLDGKQLEVVHQLKHSVIVDLPDGTRLKLPNTWTDLAPPPPQHASLETTFTVESLRELITLVDALIRRA